MSLTILRTAKADDIETMWRIDKECFEEEIAFTPDIFYYHLLVKSDPAFIAEKNHKVVGFVLTSHNENGAGLIVTIDVVKSARRKGVASLLIEKAENAHTKKGALLMRLQTGITNDKAIAFYNKHRYSNLGVIKNYYGQGKDAFLFEKRLNR